MKQSEGLFAEESLKFKHGDDLDYFCLWIKGHFEKHGLDTIAYRKDPNAHEMLILFKHYPKFTKDVVKGQNETSYNKTYDDYHKQNNKDAIKCFISLINKELGKELLVKI